MSGLRQRLLSSVEVSSRPIELRHKRGRNAGWMLSRRRIRQAGVLSKDVGQKCGLCEIQHGLGFVVWVAVDAFKELN